MKGRISTLDTQVLHYLADIGLLSQVPEAYPGQRKVLARSVCFLHDGADNPNAFLLFADGYVCDTNKCHTERTFGCNLPGLVRHMVYRVSGEVMDWRKAWRYARANPTKLKELVGDAVRHARPSSSDGPRYASWSASALAACLQVPDPYYLSRGYQAETLRHFGVGRCVRPLPDGKRLLGWSVFPVLGAPHLPPYGYTARNPRWVEGGEVSKWHHALKRSQCLFNGWAAYPERGPLIICEGPGDVMRFWEAGLRGAVAVFSNSLSDPQYFQFLSLLHRDRKVYIAPDNDDAGRRFAEQVCDVVKGVCDPVVVFPPSTKDFGEATVAEIRALAL
jgi:hypothetical protein